NDTCILAGDTLRFDVTAIDPPPAPSNVTLSATGGIMDSNIVSDPAHFTPLTQHNDTVRSRFVWATKCHHIREQPYSVLFRAEDSPGPGQPALVDLHSTFIHVIAPPPPSATAVAIGSAIDLHWSPAPC